VRAEALAVLAIGLLLEAGRPARADEKTAGGDETATELAKMTQNPVADLISVPFQNNFNFGADTDRKMVWIMSIQPVIPIHLTENWNLITRTIVPIINQPSLAPGMESAAGIGDINPSVFLSPAKAKGFIWGVGVTTTLPTATQTEIGSGAWADGGRPVHGGTVGRRRVDEPAVVDRRLESRPVQRDAHPAVHQLQPLRRLVHQQHPDHHRQLLGRRQQPLDPAGGRRHRQAVAAGKIGLPLNIQIVPYYNAVTPDFGPDWQLRFQLQFLFPR